MRMDVLLIFFLLIPWVSWKCLGKRTSKSGGRAAAEAAPTHEPMEHAAEPGVRPRREPES